MILDELLTNDKTASAAFKTFLICSWTLVAARGTESTTQKPKMETPCCAKTHLMVALCRWLNKNPLKNNRYRLAEMEHKN